MTFTNSEQRRVYETMMRQGSKLEAKLFMLTSEFTLDDWRIMRPPAYWAALDSFPVNQIVPRLQYKLSVVEKYLARKKLND